jgi:hypothetical protein
LNNFLLLLTLMGFLIWTPAGLTKADAETAGVWGKTLPALAALAPLREPSMEISIQKKGKSQTRTRI